MLLALEVMDTTLPCVPLCTVEPQTRPLVSFSIKMGWFPLTCLHVLNEYGCHSFFLFLSKRKLRETKRERNLSQPELWQWSLCSAYSSMISNDYSQQSAGQVPPLAQLHDSFYCTVSFVASNDLDIVLYRPAYYFLVYFVLFGYKRGC